ncbi:MAG: hypothetical protein SFW36_24175 [Leptolyngbyaceae cyanobacterium bins.59]|nr:hypothetical protein [Leptolyngbyaceae cyanobacterium bins.59]
MVQYTFAQAPEVILTVSGKDSAKTREQAMDQLFTLLDEGTLAIDLPENFGPRQFIEVKEAAPVVEAEETVNQAIQTLNTFMTLRLRMQESRTEALKARANLNLLFGEKDITEEEATTLREGFKILKGFAQMNLRYSEAQNQAQQALEVLDRALQVPSDD